MKLKHVFLAFALLVGGVGFGARALADPAVGNGATIACPSPGTGITISGTRMPKCTINATGVAATPAAAAPIVTSTPGGVLTFGCTTCVTGLTAGTNMVVGTGPTPSVAVTNAPTFTGTTTIGSASTNGATLQLGSGCNGGSNYATISTSTSTVQGYNGQLATFACPTASPVVTIDKSGNIGAAGTLYANQTVGQTLVRAEAGEVLATATGVSSSSCSTGGEVCSATTASAGELLLGGSTDSCGFDYGATTASVFSVGCQLNTTTTTGLSLTNGTSNLITYNTAGVAAPSFTTTSAGEKIRVYPAETGSTVDFGIGIASGTMWFSVPSVDFGTFNWYGGTTSMMTLNGGNLTVTSNLVADGLVEANGGSCTLGSTAGDIYAARSGCTTGVIFFGAASQATYLYYNGSAFNLTGPIAAYEGGTTTLGYLPPFFGTGGAASGIGIHGVIGTCAFSSATSCAVTLSGSAQFTGANTYSCSADKGSASLQTFGWVIGSKSASGFTIYSTPSTSNSNTASFVCIGT